MYPWHPLRGQSIAVHRRQERDRETWLLCELPDRTLSWLPEWMTERAACRRCIVGEPVCSMEALQALRVVLDTFVAAHPCNTEGIPIGQELSHAPHSSSAIATRSSPPEPNGDSSRHLGRSLEGPGRSAPARRSSSKPAPTGKRSRRGYDGSRSRS